METKIYRELNKCGEIYPAEGQCKLIKTSLVYFESYIFLISYYSPEVEHCLKISRLRNKIPRNVTEVGCSLY